MNLLIMANRMVADRGTSLEQALDKVKAMPAVEWEQPIHRRSVADRIGTAALFVVCWLIG